MPKSGQIKYAGGMKIIPESWKIYIPLLLLLMLMLTVVGDHYRPLPEPADHGLPHAHDHGEPAESTDRLDQAFNQAPDPGAIPPDPEREHRMAIFHYNEGNKFLSEGDWREAVRNYKMALHHDKALSEVYINMSTAYLQGEQYEEAKKALETLKAQAPGHPNLYYNLACYYSLTHQEAASLAALKRSIQLGYQQRGDVHTDPDLENLRQTPEFEKWVETL